MLGVARRVRARIGVVRTWLEASATLVGFAMGGTVGIGTLAFAFGIGPAIELSFRAAPPIGAGGAARQLTSPATSARS